MTVTPCPDYSLAVEKTLEVEMTQVHWKYHRLYPVLISSTKVKTAIKLLNKEDEMKMTGNNVLTML